jgi:hypothetical protein
MDFPRLLYRLGGPWALEAGDFSVLEVADEEQFASAQSEGWHLDQYAAKDAADAEQAQRDAEFAARIAGEESGDADGSPASTAPRLTRDELEAKAAELKIPFGPRVTDKKLAALISAALSD